MAGVIIFCHCAPHHTFCSSGEHNHMKVGCGQQISHTRILLFFEDIARCYRNFFRIGFEEAFRALHSSHHHTFISQETCVFRHQEFFR